MKSKRNETLLCGLNASVLQMQRSFKLSIKKNFVNMRVD